MKTKRLLTITTAAALILSIALSGCSSSDTTANSDLPTASDSSSTVTSDATFSYALPSDIVSLDPAYAYDLITGPVVNQITESLLVFDNDGLLQPLLCYEWEIVDDTTYVYQIRDDVTFSDGSPMTMDDVTFSLARYMDAEVASYIAWMYDSVDFIEQTGDWELTVHLSQPDALWQYTFATSGGHVISKDYYEAHSDDFGTPSGGTMGTGPYVFESWETGSQITLVKNESYWDTEVLANMSIDTVIYPIIVEDTTRVQAILNGEIDYTTEPPIDMMTELEAASNVTVESFETYSIDFLAFNTEVAPFNDENVRRAIASLVDKEVIADVVMKDYAVAANAIPMGQSLFTIERDNWESFAESSADYAYDIDAAMAYLAASDYPDGFECTLLCNETSAKNSIALMLQQACAQIGITVNIEKVTNDELINMQFGSSLNEDGTKAYDMGIFTWISDFPDVSGNLYPLFLSTNKVSGGSNTTGYTNTDVDALLLEQAQSIDTAERTALLQEVCDYLYEEVPQVNIVYPNTICVYGDRVNPFEVSSAYIWNMYIKDVDLK